MAAAATEAAAPQAPSPQAAFELWLSRGPGIEMLVIDGAGRETGTRPGGYVRTEIPDFLFDSSAIEDATDPSAVEVPQLNVVAVSPATGTYEVVLSGEGRYVLSYTAAPALEPGVQRVSGPQLLRGGEVHRYRLTFDPADTSRCTLARVDPEP